MRKRKYGEDTVVMRIPRSLVPEVRELLKSAEVVGRVSPGGDDAAFGRLLERFTNEASRQDLLRAYRLGFCAGEELHLAQMLENSGQADKIPVVLDKFRNTSADSDLFSSEFIQALLHISPAAVHLTNTVRDFSLLGFDKQGAV